MIQTRGTEPFSTESEKSGQRGEREGVVKMVQKKDAPGKSQPRKAESYESLSRGKRVEASKDKGRKQRRKKLVWWERVNGSFV